MSQSDPDRPQMLDVAALAELPEGTMKGVDVGEERVLLARVAGEVHAVGAFCTHQIAHLEDGVLDGPSCQVFCPRHGAAFDLRSGAPLSAPADMPLETYAVDVVAGRIRVSLRPRPCRGS